MADDDAVLAQGSGQLGGVVVGMANEHEVGRRRQHLETERSQRRAQPFALGDHRAPGALEVVAVLKRRHRASDEFVRSLAPFGCAGARPTVEIDFDLNGVTWHLRKAFCHKPYEALLMVAGGGAGLSFKGDAAEEELSRLLGLPRGNRSVTKPAEQGVWGLFWVSQGTAFEPDGAPSDGSRTTLTGALEDELGRVLGGDAAPALLTRIRQRCDALFTQARNNPQGELKVALEDKAKAQQNVARLEAALSDYRDTLAELQSLRDERACHEREQTLAQAEAAVRAAEQEQQRIGDLQQREQQRAREAELAHTRYDQARGAWRARILTHQDDAVILHIRRQNRPRTILNHPARGRKKPDIYAVFVGQQAVFLGLTQLKRTQAQNQNPGKHQLRTA